MIFLPIRNSGTNTLDVKQQTSIRGIYGAGFAYENQPELRHSCRRVSRIRNQEFRRSATTSSRQTVGTTSTYPRSAWRITSTKTGK